MSLCVVQLSVIQIVDRQTLCQTVLLIEIDSICTASLLIVCLWSRLNAVCVIHRKISQIYDQMRRLGLSVDWTRACFTLDKVCSLCSRAFYHVINFIA